MSLIAQNIFNSVRMSYDGITRTYHCETHFDTVILFDALYKGTQWETITVICLRTNRIIQNIQKPE